MGGLLEGYLGQVSGPSRFMLVQAPGVRNLLAKLRKEPGPVIPYFVKAC